MCQLSAAIAKILCQQTERRFSIQLPTRFLQLQNLRSAMSVKNSFHFFNNI